MQSFDIVGLTLPGMLDPALVIAASRAEGIGVLNLEGVRNAQQLHAAFSKILRHTQGRVGIRLDSRDPDLLHAVLPHFTPVVQLVILTAHDTKLLRQSVHTLHETGCRVWVEVTDIEQARQAVTCSVDGLIAKGNEAGGWVGDETIFVLIQHLLSEIELPIWGQGGIGVHTAVACYAAGAAGVVLDAQLALARESQLTEQVKRMIAALDGSETICLGADVGLPYRVFGRRGSAAIEQLQMVAATLGDGLQPSDSIEQQWRAAINARLGWDHPEEQIWPFGQDAVFAAGLAQRYQTVGGIFSAIHSAIDTHLDIALRLRPLDKDAPLARSHGTRYPIVQGPMTRVSDTAAFALHVAQGGGLPFLALALMRAPEVAALLAETKQLLGELPWGVGILGFVPPHLSQEQIQVIRKYRPPFALIAGGRPEQAQLLEQDGILSYLHVPSPGLLRLFFKDGTRRFVFEGRECGGHVGPRSSFVLWNTMIDLLLEQVSNSEAENCHLLFAGGIHDAVSSAMVAAMTAPLAERGMRVGVLMGSAYLFTEEAVTTGAIMPGFQAEAVACQHTALLETGPGHATRCAETAFVELFRREKQDRLAAGETGETLRTALEKLNLGRLRIASKGINRHPGFGRDPTTPKYIAVDDDHQRREGMYMIGQIASLHDQICTVEELHCAVAEGGAKLLDARVAAQRDASSGLRENRPCDIAIVGMSCLLPKAPDVTAYWENILNKIDAITEVPADRWEWQRYYDPDRRVRDKIYSRWGGFLEDVAFDPVKYGIPPNALRSIEPIQLLVLEAVRAALTDAGYADRPFPRERASVILGAGGGAGALGEQYSVRTNLPELLEEVPESILAQLPEWTEDSFPGILLNVIAGRVANRFDLGGLNYTVDAACASSLAALYLATRELETGTSDLVITGGVDNVQNPFGFMCFSKTQALSPRGHCRTFDEAADGIAISEGVTIVILKRLHDAVRDGDRIYAVIKGVGGSSDGRDRSLTAPHPQGQARAVERAYTKAGISPATVTLIEAHGTGTVVGDQAELETLKTVFEAADAPRQRCAVGSVKSMIGHTKCAAGIAGLMKVALALHHKVLPPTLGVERPNAKANFPASPFYVNSETRPWLNGIATHPRRAGVSAFGFGGTNFHAVLEEYTGDFLPTPPIIQTWPSELCLWSAPTTKDLIRALGNIDQALAQGARPELRDLAYALYQDYANHPPATTLRLAIVATSLDDLIAKLTIARTMLAGDNTVDLHDPRGIYCTAAPMALDGKIAFLFPGQGSQYPNMLRDLAVRLPEIRETFEHADLVLSERFGRALSDYIFPMPAFTAEDERRHQEDLTATHVAQPALGAANLALARLLARLGIQPQLVAGHSYGEYVALCAAGAIDETTLALLSEARGRSILEAATGDLGTMVAVQADAATVASLLDGVEDVWIANLNAPRQTMISGTKSGIATLMERLNVAKVGAKPIHVACAFHSPLVKPAQERLADVLAQTTFAAPQIEVFSNITASPYPHSPDAIGKLLAEHLVQPVRFSAEIDAMYDAGARILVEVGPRNVLTALTDQILDGRRHLAIAVDAPGLSGITQLQHALAQLAVHSVPVQLDRLFQGRLTRPKLDLRRLAEDTAAKPLPPTTWFVNGSRARPMSEPKTLPHQRVALSTTHTHQTNGHSKASPDAVEQVSASAQEHLYTHAASIPTALPVAPSEMRNANPAVQPSTNHQPAAPAPANAGQIMLQFQGLMAHFLETQRSVMLRYVQTTLAASTTKSLDQQQTAPDPLLVVPAPPAAVAQSAAAPEPLPKIEEVPTQLDRSSVMTELLRIVAERTGYPTDMLDLDLDLEANLGIDSIKRVEILGQLRQTLETHGLAPDQLPIDQLSSYKTLRGLADLILDAWQRSALHADDSSTHLFVPPIADRLSNTKDATDDSHAMAHPGPEAAARNASRSGTNIRSIERFTVQATEHPYSGASAGLAAGRTILITDDETGVAQQIASRLLRQGYPVALLRHRPELSQPFPAPVYAVDLRSGEMLERVLGCIRNELGLLAAVVHLAPLRPAMPFAKMSLSDWRERLAYETRSLFLLAKAVQQDLEQAAQAGGAALVAASNMGGGFGSSPFLPGDTEFFPGAGAISGLVKTIAIEWPTVRVKAIDLLPAEGAESLADHLVTELMADDAEPEIGWRAGRRLVLQPTPAPLGKTVELIVESDWVVLVTGGARGITAEIALELATRYQPTLVLVGRSPRPTAHEPPHTAGLSTPRDLKAALIAHMRAQGQTPTPAQVEQAYRQVLNEREIRANLRALAAAGSRVHYYAVDVRDEAAFGTVINDIYETFGQLDGVIHGAGLIEDKLLKAKTVESFDAVVATKADGAFILSRHLKPEALRFLVLFSSVSGRFGNRGQADYAAANEVLNKLAIYLDARWSARVIAVNWGPWQSVGMVSEELQHTFAQRGIALIPAEVGRRMLDDELCYGSKGACEVIIAGATKLSGDPGAPFPLLAGVVPQITSIGVTCTRTIDPAHDLYLRDHLLDQRPVFPFAMALELMVEVAQQGWPDLQVIGVRAMQLYKGLVLETGPKTVRLVARTATEPPTDRIGADVIVEIIDCDRPQVRYYRATIELADRMPSIPQMLPPPDHLLPFPLDVAAAYEQWLFHGPLFAGITTIEGIAEHGIIATLAPSSPRRCLSGGQGMWLIDPIVFDSGLQMVILWTRAVLDMTPLPARFRHYRRFGSLSRDQIRCYMQVSERPEPGANTFTINIYFADVEGVLLGVLEGMECPMSTSLNRLAQG